MPDNVNINARLSNRVSVYFSAIFDSASLSSECMVLQISEGGMMLSSRAELDVKSRGTFSLRAFEGEPDITVSGEIIHRLYEREPAGSEPRIRYGVRFLSAKDSEKAKISRVIRSASIRRMYFDDTPDGA